MTVGEAIPSAFVTPVDSPMYAWITPDTAPECEVDGIHRPEWAEGCRPSLLGRGQPCVGEMLCGETVERDEYDAGRGANGRCRQSEPRERTGQAARDRVVNADEAAKHQHERHDERQVNRNPDLALGDDPRRRFGIGGPEVAGWIRFPTNPTSASSTAEAPPILNAHRRSPDLSAISTPHYVRWARPSFQAKERCKGCPAAPVETRFPSTESLAPPPLPSQNAIVRSAW
jgi:hypothetical protein